MRASELAEQIVLGNLSVARQHVRRQAEGPMASTVGAVLLALDTVEELIDGYDYEPAVALRIVGDAVNGGPR